jgi:hypothetical protein
MGNGNKILYLRKCVYCRGKDGKEKDIYETFQIAFDTAKFIEEDRGIYLNVYKCPHNNGWHLTKSNASSEIIERKKNLFQNNDIPLISSDGSWEYYKDEHYENIKSYENDSKQTLIYVNKEKKHSIPIIKIECNQETNNIILFGKIMEVIKNVDIEKIFNINIQNTFCANIIKNILDDIIDQITIYVKNTKSNQLESYTILIKRELIKNNKISKGKTIKLSIVGKTINKINRWCCNKIMK